MVLWNLAEQVEGNGLFDALRGELRAVLAFHELPEPLQSRDAFDAWCQTNNMHNLATVLRVDQLGALSRLFTTLAVSFRIQHGKSTTIYKSDAKHGRKYEIRLRYHDDSHKYEIARPGTLTGLAGLEFWLRSIKPLLPAFNDTYEPEFVASNS